MLTPLNVFEKHFLTIVILRSGFFTRNPSLQFNYFCTQKSDRYKHLTAEIEKSGELSTNPRYRVAYKYFSTEKNLSRKHTSPLRFIRFSRLLFCCASFIFDSGLLKFR